MSDILDFAREFYKFDLIKDNIPFWQVLSAFDQRQDRLVIMKDKSFNLGAIYLKLTDDTIEKIFSGEKTLLDMDDFIDEDGNNIHFLFVTSKSVKFILKGLKKIIKTHSPKTVSWFKPDGSLRIIKFRR